MGRAAVGRLLAHGLQPFVVSLVHRLCDGSWAVVATDSTIPLRELAEHRPTGEQIEAAFLQACGLLPQAVDAGDRFSFDRPSQLAWSADNRWLVVSEQDIGETHGSLLLWDVKNHTPTEISSTAEAGFQLGTNGGLFFWRDGISSDGALTTELVRVDLANDNHTAQVLPSYSDASFSPDGQWLTYRNIANQYVRRNLATAEEVVLGEYSDLAPLRWTQDNRLILASYAAMDPQDGTIRTVALLATDGSTQTVALEPGLDLVNPKSPMIFISADALWTWTPTKTCGTRWHSAVSLVASPMDYSAGIDPDCTSLELTNQSTKTAITLLDPKNPDSGLALGPPVIPPADGSLFFWSQMCAGFFRSECMDELRRASLPSGTVTTVAKVHPQERRVQWKEWAPQPFAVSPDGRHLAISTTDGIYVKELVP